MKPWNASAAGADDISQLVYLSHLIGQDEALVQPGGGNTSVKLEEPDLFGGQARSLVVKGSGTDLRTIGPGGFTHLYLERLATALTPGPSPRGRGGISDEEMMAVMRACMLYPDRDPVPSVETPLHSLLPHRFVAHTHDVATLSLTDTPHAAENVRRAFGDDVAFLEYVRPGFPLAQRLAAGLKPGLRAEETRRALGGAIALVMEKHGLAAWGDSAKECYSNLCSVIEKAQTFVAQQKAGKRVFGARGRAPLREDARRDLAAVTLPVIRGELMANGWRCVLHLDDSPETLEAIGDERFAEVAARGVMTPEHILRAGVRPLVIEVNQAPSVGAQHPPLGEVQPSPNEEPKAATREHTAGAAPLQEHVRQAIRAHRDEYLTYARANGRPDPIPDYLKTIVIPGIGIVYAGRDRRNALVAASCYRATMQAMAGAEAVERFEFLSAADTCEMEYWPLERRKIEESAKARPELDGKIAMIIGAAGGIGRAAALRFAQEGAHVALVDLDLAGATSAADEINSAAPERAFPVQADVSQPDAVAAAVRRTVLRFGGVDVLFYSPGVGPRYHPVAEMPDEEVEQKMRVHYYGAVAATRDVSRVMIAQGTGGRLVYNASKAAFAPGEGFAAYGASKAALVQYVRNAASELGRHGVTANYINADAIDTPMFRGIVTERARQAGVSEEQMLQRYAERSPLREAMVPPEAVAEAALWLASDRAAHTTGCVITVGGGHEGFPR